MAESRGAERKPVFAESTTPQAAEKSVIINAIEDPFELLAEAISGIVWTFDLNGLCSHVSRRWFEYTGSEPLPAPKINLSRFIHPADVAAGEQIWSKPVDAGQNDPIELRLRRHDGVYRWHRFRIVPHHDSEGRLKNWVCAGIDIEAEKKAQQDAANSRAELARVKEELEAKVTERTHELQEVVEQLESFAYSIAHDMRAPLRSMHQYAQTVAQDFGSQVPDEARNYLNKIMRASEKLDSLIREVLVYTRVSQGRIVMQPINLEQLLSEILVMYPQLHGPNVELSARLPLHSVMGDPTALTQAFSNLLANGVKFVPTGRKPKLEVWTEQAGENVRIFFKDNGIGIPAGDRDRIFKMFERLQPESQYEGSGIGLTIVRRAVERMGGKLSVESEEGQGSTFWIELKKGAE